MDFISIILITIILVLMIKGIIGDLKQNKAYKPRKRKKRHDPNNNYFRNSPEHVDMTDEYIRNIWDENK